MRNTVYGIAVKVVLAMVILSFFGLPQFYLEAADMTIFEVTIVDKNGPVIPTIYNWGSVSWDDIANGTALPWQTPDPSGNGLAIKITWVPDPLNSPAVGVQIYTDNYNGVPPYEYTGSADNPGGLVLSGVYIPMCWRVFTYFGTGNPPGTMTGPNQYQLKIDEVKIDETNIERSLLYDAACSWPDVNGDGLIWIDGSPSNPPALCYDMNGDGVIGKCVIISDYAAIWPQAKAYIELFEPSGWAPPYNIWDAGDNRWENASGNPIPAGRIGYYPCYLWMIDKNRNPIVNGIPQDPNHNKTPMEDEPYRTVQGNPINACYATVVAMDRGMAGDVDGIQHAEHTFAWRNNIIYVVLGAKFGNATAVGTYGCNTITVELYGL